MTPHRKAIVNYAKGSLNCFVGLSIYFHKRGHGLRLGQCPGVALGPKAQQHILPQHGIFSSIPHPLGASVLVTVALLSCTVTSNMSQAPGQSVFVRQSLSHGDVQDVTSAGTSFTFM